jgi:hypothetical protein
MVKDHLPVRNIQGRDIPFSRQRLHFAASEIRIIGQQFEDYGRPSAIFTCHRHETFSRPAFSPRSNRAF